MEIKKAVRTKVKPLIVLYSESGCGKSYSALLLARGFVGPDGKVCVVDSESGRGSLYADVIQGGYDTLQLTTPFTSARYVEAIDTVEKAGYSIGIIDSGSHEWDSVLSAAGDIEERSGKPGLHCWKTPKMEHSKFVLRLLQSSIPWIVCLRAKYKSRQTKEERNGKMVSVIVRDDYTSPLQAEDFIFEATCHGEIMPNHHFRLTKANHPALPACFPKDGVITEQHGALLADWCNNPTLGGKKEPPKADPNTEPNTPPPDTATADKDSRATRIRLLGQLYALTPDVHKITSTKDHKPTQEEKDAGLKNLNTWLQEQQITDTLFPESIATMDNKRLFEVVESVKKTKGV